MLQVQVSPVNSTLLACIRMANQFVTRKSRKQSSKGMLLTGSHHLSHHRASQNPSSHQLLYNINTLYKTTKTRQAPIWYIDKDDHGYKAVNGLGQNIYITKV